MGDYMTFNEQNYLCHYGIKGMKWGIRRYQNPDGSLTTAGRARYGDVHGLAKHIQSENLKASKLAGEAAIADRAYTRTHKAFVKSNGKWIKAKSKYGENSEKASKARTKAITKGLANEMALENRTEKRAAIDKHYKQLVKEFGKERVGNVIYNKKGEISDGVKKGDIIVASALLGGANGGSLATVALASLALAFDKDPVTAKTGVRTAGKNLAKSYQKQAKSINDPEDWYRRRKN